MRLKPALLLKYQSVRDAINAYKNETKRTNKSLLMKGLKTMGLTILTLF